jgi:hypothetical protein
LHSVSTEAFKTTAYPRRFEEWRETKTLSGYTTETEEGPSNQTPIEEDHPEDIIEMSGSGSKSTSTATLKEFIINKPKELDGNRKDVQSFILDCKVYLQVNQHIYTNDDSKVAFVLLFMNKKEAKRWKENCLLTLAD